MICKKRYGNPNSVSFPLPGRQENTTFPFALVPPPCTQSVQNFLPNLLAELEVWLRTSSEFGLVFRRSARDVSWTADFAFGKKEQVRFSPSEWPLLLTIDDAETTWGTIEDFHAAYLCKILEVGWDLIFLGLG